MNNHSIQYGQLSVDELLHIFYQTQSDFPSLKDETTMKERAQKLASNADFIICRNEKNEVIAYIAAYMNQPPLCYLTQVSVFPAYKHQGISQKMLAYLENKMKTLHCSLMKLEVRTENTIAIKAYTKYGFKIIESNSNNSYIMEKRI